MSKILDKKRDSRKKRVRAKIFGTAQKPRVSVFKSNRNVLIQVIDDDTQKTIISVSKKNIEKSSPKKEEIFEKIGESLAAGLKSKKIGQAVLDRGRYKYHGSIKKIAEAMRKSGIRV